MSDRPEFNKMNHQDLEDYLLSLGIPEDALKGKKRMELFSMASKEYKFRHPDEEEGRRGERTKPGPKPKTERRMRIMIHPEKGELSTVFLAVNGRQFQIPREKEVNLPIPHFEALENAFYTITDEEGIPRQVRRFNYTVIGEVTTDRAGDTIEAAA